MKSNKKGFTLIELLAVIVILAIIALIATPIIINIVQKARKSAAQDSVYGIMKAMELAYVESMLDPIPLDLPIEGTFTETTATYKAGTPGAETDKVTYSGTSPKKGSIKLENKDGALVYTLTDLEVNGFVCKLKENSNKEVICGA